MTELADGIHCLDLWEEGRPGRAGTYLLLDDEPTLVDVGSSRSLPHIVQGLADLGMTLEDIAHVVITHVHLDHAGGAGSVMEAAPQAVLHCHPRAVRHLVNPARLRAGAEAVYGARIDALFGPIRPVAVKRVRSQEDGSTVSTGSRRLTFLDTPGHAKHHCCILESRGGGLFSGDTVGERFVPRFTGWDFVYGLPTTSPSDFDPDVVERTLDRLQALKPRTVYHTHFGPTTPAAEAFSFTHRGIEGLRSIIADLTPTSPLSLVKERLVDYIRGDLERLGHPAVDLSPLALDIDLNSQGMLVYVQKRALGKL